MSVPKRKRFDPHKCYCRTCAEHCPNRLSIDDGIQSVCKACRSGDHTAAYTMLLSRKDSRYAPDAS